MFKKIKTVEPLSDYILLVGFENGEKRYYDIKPLFDKWQCFEALRETNGLYALVKVDAGGYGISWNDDIDLSCNELYYNGKLTA